MHYYEIRVGGDDGKTALILAEFRDNDDAAIRAARKIAHNRKFEIWRGSNCIYQMDAAQPIPNHPAVLRP